MRAIKIGADDVMEIEGSEADILIGAVTWDCARLDDGHYLWVNDFGLQYAKALGTIVRSGQRIPLPAFILGFEGERSVCATIGVEEARHLVRIDRPIVPADGVAAIGMDVRLEASRGPWRPLAWRAVLALPGRFDTREYLMRLPAGDAVYVSPPIHERHGSLLDLPRSPEEQVRAIGSELERSGCTTVRIGLAWCDGLIARLLRDQGFAIEEVELPLSDELFSDMHSIGGDAGLELAELADPDRVALALELQGATWN